MLYLSFAVHLENYAIDRIARPKGPIFHRWLPNGRSDAIHVPTGDERNKIELWFERKGYLERDFIRYDPKREEVDVKVMRLQGRLEAGPLRGECQYATLTSGELEAIRMNQTDSGEYIRIGKRVVDFLYNPVSEFIDILRTQYGQYWLPEIRPWDSRTQSLGGFCSSALSLQWRENEHEQWHPFRPTAISQTIYAERLPGRGFGEYLTKEDWRRIQQTFNPGEGIYLPLRLIGKSHELWDTGHLKEAFIVASSAAELAVKHFMSARTSSLSKEAKSSTDSLINLSLKAQISVLAMASFSVPQSTSVINDAVLAIDLRNGIVHEGKDVKKSDIGKFLALLHCIKLLLGLDELKTPEFSTQNQLSPPEYGGREAMTFDAFVIDEKSSERRRDN